MKISKTAQALALAAAIAVAIPGLALAQSTGTRLPSNVTAVDPVVITGAIDDGKQTVRGEDPADAAMSDIPAVYDVADNAVPADQDAPVAAAPQSPK